LRRPAAVAAVLGALAAAGCSSYPLDSLFSKHESDVDRTGSVGRPGGQAGRAADAAQPPEADLAYARAAAAAALARGAKDNSVPWQNPNTGAGGNITPLAASDTEGGFPCRDFLASYVHGESQTWLQGSACRTSRGEWEIKNLKPLKSG